jgi:hypothetical protein
MPKDGYSQRIFAGYKLSNSGQDTVYGEFNRPELNQKPSTQSAFQELYLGGQKFDYLELGNTSQLLQRLSGESVRLYRSLDLANPEFYILEDERMTWLTQERINLELGKQFSSCNALSNAMAYTKVKYKIKPLVELINQYTNCLGIDNPRWSRSDSLEFNFSVGLLSGLSKVQDQPFKDHSGDFSNIQSRGWGLTLTAFSDRRIRLITGLNVFEMATANSDANVYPFADPSFNASVQYQWKSYEIPISAAYNFNFDNWRAYAGLGGHITITDNLIVSEAFRAPYLSSSEEVNARLIVNDHFGFGSLVGIERKLGRRWVIGLQYEWQRSQMDFNLVRIERNLLQQPPIITTYRISTLELFASATDMTKFSFTTNRLTVSLKFRAFWNYDTFN